MYILAFQKSPDVIQTNLFVLGNNNEPLKNNCFLSPGKLINTHHRETYRRADPSGLSVVPTEEWIPLDQGLSLSGIHNTVIAASFLSGFMLLLPPHSSMPEPSRREMVQTPLIRLYDFPKQGHQLCSKSPNTWTMGDISHLNHDNYWSRILEVTLNKSANMFNNFKFQEDFLLIQMLLVMLSIGYSTGINLACLEANFCASRTDGSKTSFLRALECIQMTC